MSYNAGLVAKPSAGSMGRDPAQEVRRRIPHESESSEALVRLKEGPKL